MSRIALILAGHGSHISANTAGVVWGYVDRLRQLGVADEVTACFWKEPPAYSQALDTVEADEVVVVPLFTARGYFTQEVLPSEMALSGSLTRRGNRRIHLTPTIGEHEVLEKIVDKRLGDVISRFGLSAHETAVAIIGHGTRRNRHSRDTAMRQADRIRANSTYNEVVAVYLDDLPDIPSVYHSTSSPNIIALPYFLAQGSHVSTDVPRALGIAGMATEACVHGRKVAYAEPVGADESVIRAILDLASATGLPFAAQTVGSDWAGFPTSGRRALRQALEARRILRFGQVMVSSERAWHCESDHESRAFTTPAALRSFVRDIPFRPLPSSADLPVNWHVDLATPADARAVLETVYPGLVADWAAQAKGRIETDSLEDIGRRQDGMFKDIHKLTRVVIEATLRKVCGQCVRQPTWWQDLRPTSDVLPCRSACNLWLSTARKTGDAR